MIPKYIIIILFIALLFIFYTITITITNNCTCGTFLENFTFNETNVKKYKICVMAIFKNEQDYMEEWLKHHIDQQISHFYLYSNDANMQNYPFLNNYQQYITLIPWVDQVNDENGTVQKKAYGHCVRNYNNEMEYIMMLDLDEFLISINGKKVIDVINDLDYHNTKPFKAAKVPRFDFGSNQYITKPLGNVMDLYKKREKICSSYKTIANINYIDMNRNFCYVHDFIYNDKIGHVYNDYFKYNETVPIGCKEDTINEISLIINHYYMKSREEYMKRCNLWKDGGVNNINYRQNCDESFYEKDKTRNQITIQ